MADKLTTRVQMELPETSLQRLKVLRDKTEAVSYAEVTRNAYRLYERLITLKEAGNTFLIKDSDGKIKELEVFI